MMKTPSVPSLICKVAESSRNINTVGLPNSVLACQEVFSGICAFFY